MIPPVTQNFPTQTQPLLDGAGNMSQVGRFFFQALWQRTGQGTGIPMTVGTYSGAGSTRADAPEMSDDINYIDQVSAGQGVALFQNIKPGMIQIVFNDGLNDVNVYAPAGSMLDADGPPGKYTLPAGKAQVFVCISSSLIKSLQLG